MQTSGCRVQTLSHSSHPSHPLILPTAAPAAPLARPRPTRRPTTTASSHGGRGARAVCSPTGDRHSQSQQPAPHNLTCPTATQPTHTLHQTQPAHPIHSSSFRLKARRASSDSTASGYRRTPTSGGGTYGGRQGGLSVALHIGPPRPPSLAALVFSDLLTMSAHSPYRHINAPTPSTESEDEVLEEEVDPSQEAIAMGQVQRLHPAVDKLVDQVRGGRRLRKRARAATASATQHEPQVQRQPANQPKPTYRNFTTTRHPPRSRSLTLPCARAAPSSTSRSTPLSRSRWWRCRGSWTRWR
jgi:hypothetical protein